MNTRRAQLLASVLSLAGCATAAAPDPMESFNRKIFNVNDRVDKAVVKPVAIAYESRVPTVVQHGVSNFFANAADAWSAANLFLQGRPTDGTREIARFVTNTTAGVLGFMDVASPLGLERHKETFGSTLTYWGVEPGAYIVWPLLGPSTARDSLAMPLDAVADPLTLVGAPLSYGFAATKAIDARVAAMPVTNVIDQAALDRYVFVRDAYLQRHRKPAKNAEIAAPNTELTSATAPADAK